MVVLSYLVDRRNRATTPWTSERDAVLIQLWADGWSASQIAEQISDVHVSRSAVIARAHRLKLPARRERHPPKIKAKGKPERTHRFQPPSPPALPPRRAVPIAPTMRRLSLFELTASSCRYPLGAWDEKATLFCGATTDGSVYCPHHHRLTCSARW